MSYSVDWETKVITIPKADTTLVSSSPDVRSLDVTDLWRSLIDIQDDEAAIPYPDIVQNTPPHALAGVTYAREIQIVNGYALLFEDGPYAVNIVGGNSNIADVVQKNQVSVNTSNSAGFQQVSIGSGLTSGQAAQLAAIAAAVDVAVSSRAPADTAVNKFDNSTNHAELLESIEVTHCLLYENGYHHSHVYAGTPPRLMHVQIDHYDSVANAQLHDGSTGLMHTFEANATYDANGLLTSYLVTQVYP